MALTRARIAGVDIPLEKRIEVALTYIYGIGPTKSKEILKKAKVNPDTRTKDLTDAKIKILSAVIEKDYTVEGQLRQTVFRNIKRLKDIRSYRGIRHKLGLPVRGQRTRTNAVTRKGRNIAVGGLKRKLEKT
jgi:small subunit ribosomal protein S13